MRGIDIVIPGYRLVGTVDDRSSYRRYVEDLRENVFTRVRSGKSPKEVKAMVPIAEHQSWGNVKS